MARSRKNAFAGFLIGPVLIGVATIALWKNESRFDYHRAAADTEPILKPAEQPDGKLISYTGSMDPGLTLPGEYVESLTGYLTVSRSAEIYAWDRDEDEDGDVTWRREWMSSVESNSRNRDIHQQLSSNQFRPTSYHVGELTVDCERIEFVDAYRTIPVSGLTLTELARSKPLHVQGDYLYLSKNHPQNLGDERVRYRGIPVPATATYFGKYEQGRGRAHQAVQRGGLIDNLIYDTGVLHHLVAGQRATALQTMKRHLERLKWIVRGVGTLAVCFGFVFFLSAGARFLYHLPLVGWFFQRAVWVVGFAAGLLLSVLTIASSYLLHNPLVLLAAVLMIGVVVYLVRRRSTALQKRVKQSLDRDFGYTVGRVELEELQFIELLNLAFADRNFDIEERKYLSKWARKHGWAKEKVTELVDRAKSTAGDRADAASTAEHLQNLIRLALADGNLSAFELKTITKTAKELGYGSADLQRLVDSTRASAAA